MSVAVAGAAAVAVAVWAGSVATAQDKTVKRFDHKDHAAKVKGTDGSVLACDTCHDSNERGKLTPVGKKDHQPCKKCHGKLVMSKRELQRSRKKDWCQFCHSKEKGPTSFAVSWSHKTHTRPGASGKQCEACHGTFGDAPPLKDGALAAGHEYCSGCHERGSEPKMTSCGGCHLDASSAAGQAAVVKPRAKSDWAVTGAFSHEKHANARRVGREGRVCLTCHANIAEAEAAGAVPMPTMKGCFDSCHDGTKAFSATGTTCTSCHTAGTSKAPPPATKPDRPARYDHAKHGKLNVDHSNCVDCHSLDASFNVKPALSGKDHKPCSNEGCHASEFYAKKPAICTACHDGSEPWIKQRAIARRRKSSEFGRDISHVTHAQGGNETCKSCHGDPYRGTAPAGGHKACAPCHAAASAPKMSFCAGCHGLGQTNATASTQKTGWSVGASFQHATHAADPKSGSETSCVQCHATIPKARKVSEVANPTMQSCDGCHDGKTAFKTTGFGCYRCHSESQK